MKKRMTAILIAALVLLALLAWVVWANGAPVLTRYGVADDEIPEAFDGFKIAQISDLHNAVFGEGNSKLLKILAGAEPDIIVITGDLIDSRHTDTGAALSFVRAAAELAPVYYVTGNHELRMDFGSIEPELEAAGAVLLRNRSVRIERGGEYIELAGIDDPSFLGADGSAKSRAASELERLSVDGAYLVLLAHRPELIETYAEYGADLVLSGHAHGGQIRLPGLGGLQRLGAQEQLDAELVLQLLNGSGDRRLRNIQRVGRSRHVAVFIHRLKVLKLQNGHAHTP